MVTIRPTGRYGPRRNVCATGSVHGITNQHGGSTCLLVESRTLPRQWRSSSPATRWPSDSVRRTRPGSCTPSANGTTGSTCRLFGALLTDLYSVFTKPGVHYRSGFFGPAERFLRDSGADIEYVPADFRRFGPIVEQLAPRVMATAVAPPDADGWLLAVAARRRDRR